MNRAWRWSVLLTALLGATSVPGQAQVVVRRMGGGGGFAGGASEGWLSQTPPAAFGVREWRAGQWARYSVSENVGASMPMMQLRTISVVGRRGADFWVETQVELSGLATGSGPVRKLAIPFGPPQARLGSEEIVMSPDSSVRRQVLLRSGGTGSPRAPFPEGWTRVGEEEITTPAGSFRTVHYRRASDELWAAGGAGPLGLVRFRSAELEIELVARGETGARSRISFGGTER
jgi:hypothetical protein